MPYRKKLYEGYFENQAGARLNQDIHLQIERDHLQFEADFSSLWPEDKSAAILEIACGYGNLLLLLRKKGYAKVEGIDISQDQVKIGQELGLDNISCEDLWDFLNKENQTVYSTIFGLDILEHFNKNELVDLLPRIKQKLLPGGKLILRTPNMDAPFASVFAYGDFTHESLFNSSSARQLFSSMGFSKVKVFPSGAAVEGVGKKILQIVFQPLFHLAFKLNLAISNRSSNGVLFSPNLIIVAEK